MRDAPARLDALESADPAASVRAVFSWSYQQLTPSAARMFRLLGIHPGPDITSLAAASLAETAPEQARQHLEELTRAHLITEHAAGRYAFHDLLRAYAASQATAIDSDADRRVAIGRMLDHYLHTAYGAALLIRPHREPITVAPPRPGAAPGRPADHEHAHAWFAAEHQVLLAAIRLADTSGFDVHAWQLPWAMMPFLEMHGRYHEWAGVQRAALAAATRISDIAGQAVSSRMLANAYTGLGNRDQARAHLEYSLSLYRQLGNRLGEAKAYQDLNVLAEREGHYFDALRHARHALRLYQSIGHRAGEAEMLNAVGWLNVLLGDYQRGRAFCRKALAHFAELGHRRLEGYTWDSVGYAEHHLGHLTEAAACYQRAIGIFREFGDRFQEADTLTHLGDTHHASGDLRQARETWRLAQAILEDLQHPDASQLRAKLAGLDS